MTVAALVVVVVALVALVVLKVLTNRPAAPDNYRQTVQTGGPIEKTYLANGPYEVLEHEDAVLQEFKKFPTYYPAELETGTDTYPVVVLCNGSGTPPSKYPTVARHLASWGFIVVGTEEDYSWNAFGVEMCLRYLERRNENQEIDGKPSPFYHKVDLDRVGVVGHSQGGVGVLNAVADTDHKDAYKAAVALSPTNKEFAHNLMRDHDAPSSTCRPCSRHHQRARIRFNPATMLPRAKESHDARRFEHHHRLPHQPREIAAAS